MIQETNTFAVSFHLNKTIIPVLMGSEKKRMVLDYRIVQAAIKAMRREEIVTLPRLTAVVSTSLCPGKVLVGSWKEQKP